MWDKSNFFANFVVLYRYMPIHAFEATLENWALKATMSYEANDPLEMTPQFEENPPTLTTYSHTNTPDHDSPPFICFSRLMSSPAMWGHYADSGKGVCLVFLLPLGKEARLWTSTVTQEQLVSFLEEKYSKGGKYHFQLIAPPRINNHLKELVSRSYLAPVQYSTNRVESKKAFIGENRTKEEIKNRGKEWSHRLITRKADTWDYEEEIRMVCHLPDADKIEGAKVLYSWPMSFFAGVIAGPRCMYSEGILHQKLCLAYERAQKNGSTNYFVGSVNPLFQYGFFTCRAFYDPTEFRLYSPTFSDRLDSEVAFRQFAMALLVGPSISPLDAEKIGAIFPDVALEIERDSPAK